MQSEHEICCIFSKSETLSSINQFKGTFSVEWCELDFYVISEATCCKEKRDGWSKPKLHVSTLGSYQV